MSNRSDITKDASDAAARAGVTVREASREDLPDALRVQHAAFTRIAERGGFDPAELPPVSETIADLERLAADGFRTFVATVPGDGGERVVGTVRGQRRDDGTVEIGRLAVDGAYLRRGIARALMLGLESAFAVATRYELFTGSDQAEALGLYASLGYDVYAREQYEHWTLVRLEKCAPASPPAR